MNIHYKADATTSLDIPLHRASEIRSMRLEGHTLEFISRFVSMPLNIVRVLARVEVSKPELQEVMLSTI